MKKSALFLVLALSNLLTVSCGSDDDDDGTRIEREEASKDLFSVWRQVGGSGFFDFRAYTFKREAPIVIETLNGSSCRCSIEFDGGQSSGDIMLRDCIGNSFECLEFIGTFSYEKSQDVLLICDPRRNCVTYR